jgi:hypothetical protein
MMLPGMGLSSSNFMESSELLARAPETTLCKLRVQFCVLCRILFIVANTFAESVSEQNSCHVSFLERQYPLGIHVWHQGKADGC